MYILIVHLNFVVSKSNELTILLRLSRVFELSRVISFDYIYNYSSYTYISTEQFGMVLEHSRILIWQLLIPGQVQYSEQLIKDLFLTLKESFFNMNTNVIKKIDFIFSIIIRLSFKNCDQIIFHSFPYFSLLKYLLFCWTGIIQWLLPSIWPLKVNIDQPQHYIRLHILLRICNRKSKKVCVLNIN
jgi:hypothetical protein